jgi:predicted dinucleotide-binding enzyme
MKIGIIGSGNVGSALAYCWVKAGHEVIISSRYPEQLEDIAKTLGKKACATSPEEAARVGDVVLLSIPLGQVPRLSSVVRGYLKGKVVMDTCNPIPERDGSVANDVLKEGQGTGVWTARQIPDARIVRAFNTVPAQTLLEEARHAVDPIGVPLASDDPEALSLVSQLVRDAGFGPVVVGSLNQGKEFDPGTSAYASECTQSELEKMFLSRAQAQKKLEVKNIIDIENFRTDRDPAEGGRVTIEEAVKKIS